MTNILLNINDRFGLTYELNRNIGNMRERTQVVKEIKLKVSNQEKNHSIRMINSELKTELINRY